MNLEGCINFLNFWIRKERGVFYTIEELLLLMDRAQMSYYNDILPKYATSQIVKDCLSPFRMSYSFTDNDTSNGLITIANLLDLLDVTISFDYTQQFPSYSVTRKVYYPVKMTNEDEIGDRLNSQIDPVTETAPLGEVVGQGKIQLYPAVDSYFGTVRYFRRPYAPSATYHTDGYIIVFDTTTPLEWRDIDINAILLKALSSIGINLADQEVSQFAEMKTQENYQGVNNL